MSANEGSYLRIPLAAQIPSAALQPEQLAKYVPEGAEVPTYINEDVENIKTYYNIGACLSSMSQAHVRAGAWMHGAYSAWCLLLGACIVCRGVHAIQWALRRLQQNEVIMQKGAFPSPAVSPETACSG
eukprot:scaffold113908_cov20-Tisochrysis_lutea.AAC.4